MPEPLDLTDPIAVLLTVVSAFERAGIDCAAYGGLALAAYGEPRETRDADVAVVGHGAADGAHALGAALLDVTVAFDRVRFGGNRVSRITILPGASAAGLNTVDLVEPLSDRYAREALGRAISTTLRGQAIRVVAPEDFVVFKLLSTRDRDVEDAVTVLRSLGTTFDLDLVERECAALALEIPDHDVAARWARVKAAARSPSPVR